MRVLFQKRFSHYSKPTYRHQNVGSCGSFGGFIRVENVGLRAYVVLGGEASVRVLFWGLMFKATLNP